MATHRLPKGWDYKPSRKELVRMRVSKVCAGYYRNMGVLKLEMTRLAELAELEEEINDQVELDTQMSEYGGW